MSREQIRIIEDDGSRCGEVLGSAMMLGNKCRGSSTSTRQTGTGTPKQEINSGQVVPVPPSKKSPEAKWYRYRYKHVIFMGIEQNSDSKARVHLSFDHQFEITMENGIKAKENEGGAAFDPRVLVS